MRNATEERGVRMLCINFLCLSISNPSSLNKQFNSKSKNPSFQPRSSFFCCSKPYSEPKTEENGQSSVKIPTLLPNHVKSITSTSNPFVKHCVKLRQSSSYRHLHGSVLLLGSTPIRELYSFEGKFEDESTTIECLFLLDNAQVAQGFNNQSIHFVSVSPVVMRKLAGLQSSDSVDMAALVRIPSMFHKLGSFLEEIECHRWFKSHHRVLVLDGIQDPGNMGTLLRTAIAFRWDGVFLLSGCCDPFNDKALRASRGASFQLPIVSGSWAHLDNMRKELHMKILAGHPAKGSELKPVSCLSQDLADSLVKTPLCLVLGSEGSGLSEKCRQECELISIPMAGEYESLNVSVAGGIFLYMLQQQPKKI